MLKEMVILYWGGGYCLMYCYERVSDLVSESTCPSLQDYV